MSELDVAMAAERIVHVDPGTKVEDLVDQIGDGVAIVSIGGKRFQVTPENQDIWANYDPERARAAINAIAGMLKDSGIDFDAWKEEIREQRGHNSNDRANDVGP